MMPFLAAVAFICCTSGQAQQSDAPRRILFLTHSAGYRHDSIPAAVEALQTIAARTGNFEVTASEDLELLTTPSLRQFDVVFFFTSGELPLTDRQKADLLDFVRSGKGFGGAHSATDTLYSWPDYGEMIGGYFDGHPWVQEVRIDVEDPAFPGIAPLAPNFAIVEEIYQHRAFNRSNVRVLMTLDTATVDLHAPGVNRTDEDFALAWCKPYGQGRVFYTALGHFDETWRDPRVLGLLEGALGWLTGLRRADCSPRASLPHIAAVATPAGPAQAHAPGAIVSIYGGGLTSGSTMTADPSRLPVRLAGTRAEVNGYPIPLYYASPELVNARLPFDLEAGSTAAIVVRSGTNPGDPVQVPIREFSPALLAAVRSGPALTLYASGLGKVDAENRTLSTPIVTAGGVPAQVRSSGLDPALPGLYRIEAALPEPPSVPLEVRLEIGGVPSNALGVD
ncbi:MAG: ThuA domain-containing protein [Bryobacterales bacterium]|nr:ThuA domain-containing protein [Bryobacterales bacterium]